MSPFSELSGSSILVTGGANGIGEATVRLFHRLGARLFFCDKDQARGQALARELGDRAAFHAVDLASERAIVEWIRAVRAATPEIRGLINNAAWDPRIPFIETSSAQWDELFAINTRAYFLTARECVPAMPAGASIVNITSVTFYNTPKNLVAYVATKGGVMGFTRCLARELGERRIRVNCISPGWVWTERQKRDYLDAEAQKMIHDRQCIPDHIQPDEIARVILFLVSDLSAAVTGQEILADRGWAHS
jgi:D-xylose 1-dehydrogenase